MYFVIETKEQLDKLEKGTRCFIDIVTLSEDAHPSLTSPSVIYFNDFNKGYIIPINHTEGFSLDWNQVKDFIQSHLKVYVLDKKWHSYFFDDRKCLIDVYHTMLDEKGSITDLDCYTIVHKDFYYKHKYLENVNSILPISKHYERCG